MNEQTLKFLEQLATKLGTTSEYLWSILLKQAPISATITLIQIILTVIGGVSLYKIHKHFMNDNNKLSYYNSEFLSVPMGIGTILWIIFAIAAFFCFEDVFNGYFNPEFWAIDYILSSLDSK